MTRVVYIAFLAIGGSVSSQDIPIERVTSEHYILFDENGTPSGAIDVQTRGRKIIAKWSVKDNGRGSETTEELELGADDLPRIWSIIARTDLGNSSGTSTGSRISYFQNSGTMASWTVNGARSQTVVSGRVLFAPVDAGQWALGLYARTLLQQGKRRLRTLPQGSMWAEEKSPEVVNGVKFRKVVLHRTNAENETLLLDKSDHLIAVGEGRVVLAGYEAVARVLREKADEVERARQVALQRTLLHSIRTPVRVLNVRVFDPDTGTLGPLSSVTYVNGVVTGVRPSSEPARPEETTIDGGGGSLIPGLHDTHFHLGLARAEGVWLSLAAGVTTVRDMGSNNAYLQRYRTDAASDILPSPRIIASGLIEGEGPFAIRDSGVNVSSEQAAIAAVRWYADHGYWQIKIYNSVDPAWVPAIAREAHNRGLRVAGHIPAFTTPDAMIKAGYDELTHANQLMLGWVLKPGEDTRTPLRLTAMSRFAALDLSGKPVRSTFALMKSQGTAFEPTLAIMRRLLTNRTGEVEAEDRWWFDHVSKNFKPGRMVTVLPGFTIMPIKSPSDDIAYRGAAAKMIELVRILNKQGTMILAGSDDNNGFILHRELELFVAAGMTPAQVLKRVTVEAARYLGSNDKWGAIKPGEAADFFLVPGDPTKDIRALNLNRMTVQQGRVYFPSEIYAALGIKPFIAAPRVVAPTKVFSAKLSHR